MNTLPTNYLRLSRALTCAFAATLAAAAFGQSSTHADTSSNAAADSTADASTSTTGSSSSLKHADRHFIEKAAESGREEVEISRAVAEHSTNADVKKFAQMMVDDHTKLNQQVEAIATARGVKLKQDDKNKDENKWAKKDPKDIDHDYVKKMVSDHKKDIELFTKESKDGADQEIVELARNALPTLQHHLEEVNNLQQTVR